MLSKSKLSCKSSRKLSKKKFIRAIALLGMSFMLTISSFSGTTAHAGDGYEFVILSAYAASLQVGDSFYLAALTSTGKRAKFSSDNSKVASVNTYGKVTAKKPGTANIRAKITDGEASCKVTVKKTVIELNKDRLSMENGTTAKLVAKVSTGHSPTFKSKKSSIASVDEEGVVLAKKPGSTTITVTADGTTASCSVTVKKPTVKLNKTTASLYRTQTVRLKATVTSKTEPKWKSNKKSVATVDEDGTVTAVKHGTAEITVTADGVSKTCKVTVKQPKITFKNDSITLKKGETAKANATVSSGNSPSYSSSNTNVADVDEKGIIRAKGKGRTYIYAKEDGVKERMTVYVEE